MDNRIALADGRTLVFREYGSPNGWPVVCNHGGLVCGTDVAPAHEAAVKLGARLISPDRPGVGQSSPKPGRTLLDWASDVRELADQLGLAEFALLGWSMGGPYALACAWALRERVTRVAVVGCVLPLDTPTAFTELNRMDQRLSEMAAHHAGRAELAFKAMGEVARHTPRVWNEMTAKGVCPRDAQALASLSESGLAGMAAPALLNAAGMVEEYRAWLRPWGFAPAQISRPVGVWQGSDDTFVPSAWAQTLAAEMPGARLHLLEGEGHFLALGRYAEILAELAP